MTSPNTNVDFHQVIINLSSKSDSEVRDYINSTNTLLPSFIHYINTNPQEVSSHPLEMKKIVTGIIEQWKISEQQESILEIAIRANIIQDPQVLKVAIQQANTKLVKLMLEHGMDPNVFDRNDKPVIAAAFTLHYTSPEKSKEIVDLFINHPKFNLHMRDNLDQTLLNFSLDAGDFVSALKLIEKGIAIDSLTSSFILPFQARKPKDMSDFEKLKNYFKNLPEVLQCENQSDRSLLVEILTEPALKLSYKELNLFINILINNPLFVKKHPNACTKVLKQIFQENVPQEKIAELLKVNPILIEKHRGQYLLSHAISSSSFLTLETLSKAGINLTESFSKPIEEIEKVNFDNFELDKSTPLFYAIYKKNYQVVEKLIELGVSFNTKNTQGQTPLEYLLATYDLEKDSLSILVFMLEHGVDVNYKDDRGESLFEKVYHNLDKHKAWPIIIYLLQKGAVLSPEMRVSLLEKAAQNNNMTVLDILIKQAENSTDLSLQQLVSKLEFNTLKDILNLSDISKVSEYLRVFLKAGLKVDTLLDEYGNTLLIDMVHSQNTRKAALLVTLGASLQKKNFKGMSAETFAEENPKVKKTLDQFLATLKENSETFQKLCLQLNEKGIGHVIGDAFLKKMTSLSGENLEGNSFKSSIQLMGSLLEYVIDNHKEQFTSETLIELKKIIQKFSFTLYITQRGDELLSRENNPHTSEGIRQLSLEIRDALNGLAIGESLILPGGWSGFPSGHAALMEYYKGPGDEIVCTEINTEDPFHTLGSDKKKIRLDTLQHYIIPYEDLKDGLLLQQLLEPRILGALGETEKDKTYKPEDIYFPIRKYLVNSDQLKEIGYSWFPGIMQIQLSGTCSVRCLLALILSKIGPEEYKPLKGILKEDVITLGLEMNKATILDNPPLTRLLSHAVPALFDRFNKSIQNKEVKDSDFLQRKEKELERLKRVKSHVNKEISPQPFSVNPPLSLSEHIGTKSKQVADNLQLPIPLSINVSDATVEKPVLPIPKATVVQTADDILRSIGDMTAFISSNMHTFLDPNPTVANFLIDIGQMLISAKEHPQLMEEYQKDSEKLLKTISDIKTLATLFYNSSVGKDKIGIQNHVALISSFASLWVLGVLVDDIDQKKGNERIDAYGFSDFMVPIHDGAFVTVDPVLEEAIIKLKRFIKNTNSEKNDLLFSFSTHGQKSDLSDQGLSYLALRNGDLHYSLAHTSKVEKWTDADKSYENKMNIFKDIIKKPSEKNWRANWLYLVGGLPTSFVALRDVARMVHFFPQEDKNGTLLQTFTPSEPIINYSPNDSSKLIIQFHVDPSRFFKEVAKHYLNDSWDTYKNLNSNQTIGFDNAPKATVNTSVFKVPYPENFVMKFVTPSLQKLIASRTPLFMEGKHHHGMTISILMDLIDEDPSILLETENRRFIDMTMFDYAGILKLMTEPHEVYSDNVLRTLKKTIDYYQTLIASEENVKKNGEVLLFLLEITQRFSSYYTHVKGVECPLSVESIRKTLRGFVEHPLTSNNDKKQHLLLSLVGSYLNAKDLTVQHIEELILAKAALESIVTQSKRNRDISPILWENYSNTLYKHQEVIEKYSQNTTHMIPLLRNIFSVFKISLPNDFSYQMSPFPLFQIEYQGSKYVYNILSGKITKNGSNVEFQDGLKLSTLYLNIFGDKELSSGIRTKEGVETQDEISDILFVFNAYNNVIAVVRKIEGKNFQYITKDKPVYHSIPVLKHAKELQIWLSTDKANPEGILVDPLSLKIVGKIDANGYFKRAADKFVNTYEWVDISTRDEAKAVTQFDPHALLWRSVDVSKPDLLECPHYTDEKGQSLIFEFDKVKKQWHLRDNPHIIISEQQKLSGFRHFPHFIVLDNLDKEGNLSFKEVLIPKKNVKALKAKEWPDVDFLQLKLVKDQPVSNSPSQNCFLAYLAMYHAQTPEDYKIALDYLKNSFRYERYTQDDLRVLGGLFNLSHEKKDVSGRMLSLKLYAAWLVQDNFKRNPVSHVQSNNTIKTMNWNSSGDDWEQYWQNNVNWESKKGKRNLSTQVEKLTKLYLARQNRVESYLQLENIVDAQELVDWGFVNKGLAFLPYMRKIQLSNPPLATSDLSFLRSDKNSSIDLYSTSYTRPGKSFASLFPHYVRIACSNDVKEKRKLQSALEAMAFDKIPQNNTMRLVLLAILFRNDPTKTGSLKEAAEKLSEIALNYINLTKSVNSVDFTHMLKDFNDLYMRGGDLPSENYPTLKVADLIPNRREIKIPDHPLETSTLRFNSKNVSLQDLNQLYDQFFETKTYVEDSPFVPFTYETEDKSLQRSIQQLNEDYRDGREKNLQEPSYQIKDTAKLVETTSHLKSKIESKLNQESAQLEKKRQEMLAVARTLPTDNAARIMEQASILGGRKKEIDESDLKALFLLGDPEQFKKMTHLTDIDHIHHLYQLIGNYLVLSNKVKHLSNILSNVKELEKTAHYASNPLNALYIQKIAQGLKTQQHVDETIDPVALLVLEEGLGLYLREDQVTKLREVISSSPLKRKEFINILMQMIQGGGKTLIFGHILALLKADGYHLSIHVIPKPQYGTGIYDMKHVSGKVLGQKEHTLVFDDHPQRFTKEYLTWVKTTFEKAIVDRDYITTTSETLRSLRCKYLKMRYTIDTLLALRGETPEVVVLEENLQLLKSILSLMRERGLFTFDEVHKAFDSLIELNMPLGEPVEVNPLQRSLLMKIVSMASSSRNSEGPLLNIKLNQQSQQSESQHKEMIAQVMTQVMEDPSFLNQLKMFGYQEDLHREAMIQYLSGNNVDLPEFIDAFAMDTLSIQQLEAIKVFIVAQQTLGGGWLKDRLSKNIMEHYGFSNDQTAVPIAIPYVANMTPSEGSDFSDPFVMVLNTSLTYAHIGLKEDQVKDLIDYMRKEGIKERVSQLEDNPQFTLESTQAAQQFYEVTGLDLYKVNKDKVDILNKVNEKLISGSKKGYDFLFSYVDAKVLPQAKIHTEQMNSHGQNTASMGKGYVAYSGSMDNKNVGTPGSTLMLEKGTNGQTIDLLIRRNDEVWVIDACHKERDDKKLTLLSDSLFDDLMKKLPKAKRELTQSIIDVEAHFKGVPNEVVARTICQYLRDTDAKQNGVIYFNELTGKLKFMHKNNPDLNKEISGTRLENIETETGLKKEQLFFYYDQDRITGVDFTLPLDLFAILTVGVNTRIPSVLQGSRRLRELAQGQRLIFATERGGLEKIASTTQAPQIAHLDKGQAPKDLLSVRHLILFTHINEVNAQQTENMSFCIQKLENVLQQYCLDRLYELPVKEERVLFKQVLYLFKKNITLDLYKEYAHKRKNLDVKNYLDIIKNQLIKPLEKIFDEKVIAGLSAEMNQIIRDALPTLKAEVDVSSSFGQQGQATLQVSKESSHVQQRQQEVKKTQVAEKKMENQAQLLKVSDKDSKTFSQVEPITEIRFKDDVLAGNDFLKKVQEYNGKNPCLTHVDDPFGYYQQDNQEQTQAEIWNLQQVLEREYPHLDKELMNPNIYVTSNFAASFSNRIDLFGTFRKNPYAFLLVKEVEQGKENWKMVLGSIDDMVQFSEQIKKQQPGTGTGIGNRQVMVFRNNHYFDPMLPGFDRKELEHPEVRALLTDLQLFCGKTDQLNRALWLKHVQEKAPTVGKRHKLREFLEGAVLVEKTPGYERSKLHEFLHSEVAEKVKKAMPAG